MVPIMQKEIDTFVHVVWNSHRIRAQKNTFLPDGIPNHIYNFPDQYGLEECGMSPTVHMHHFYECFREEGEKGDGGWLQ